MYGSRIDFKEDEQKVTKLFGFYRALVVDNRDPAFENGLHNGDEKKKMFGRVKLFIPDLMKKDESDPAFGVWASPANNPIGGRNFREQEGKNYPTTDADEEGQGDSSDSTPNRYQEHWGSCYIPVIGSYVFIFFEGGNANRPYYFGSCDILETQVPPENRVHKDEEKSQWENRWTIIRSPKSRVIHVSDDPEDCRVEITGYKRYPWAPFFEEDPKEDGKNTDQLLKEHVYDIDKEDKPHQTEPTQGNQKSILIDEREGMEKILIKDERGNFLNIKCFKDEFHIYFHGDMHWKTKKNLFFEAGEEIHFTSGTEGVSGHKDMFFNSLGSIHNLATVDINNTSGSNCNTLAGAELRDSAMGKLSIKSIGNDVYIDGNIIHENHPGAITAEAAKSAKKPEPNGLRHEVPSNSYYGG